MMYRDLLEFKTKYSHVSRHLTSSRFHSKNLSKPRRRAINIIVYRTEYESSWHRRWIKLIYKNENAYSNHLQNFKEIIAITEMNDHLDGPSTLLILFERYRDFWLIADLYVIRYTFLRDSVNYIDSDTNCNDIHTLSSMFTSTTHQSPWI